MWTLMFPCIYVLWAYICLPPCAPSCLASHTSNEALIHPCINSSAYPPTDFYLSVCLSVPVSSVLPFVHPPTNPSIHPCTHPLNHSFTIFRTFHPLTHPSSHLSICLSNLSNISNLSIFVSVSLSFPLFGFLSICESVNVWNVIFSIIWLSV